MLDTKLKNSRKFGWILIVFLLICCAVGMVGAYPVFGSQMESVQDATITDAEMLSDFVDPLSWGNYILYNEISGEKDRAYIQEEYNNAEEFYLLRKYLDYEVFDWNGEALLDSADIMTQKKLVQQDCDYLLRVKCLFSEDGELDDVQVDGTRLSERDQYDLEQEILNRQYGASEWESLAVPEKVMIVYGITTENMNSYWTNYDSYVKYVRAYDLAVSDVYRGMEMVFLLLIVLAALLIPCCKGWNIGNQKIFRVPLEIVVCVMILLFSMEIEYAQVVWKTLDGTFASVLVNMGLTGMLPDLMVIAINGLMWFAVAAAVYWGITCLRAVFTMKGAYFRERTIIAKVWQWLKKRKDRYGNTMKAGAGGVTSLAKRICGRCKRFCHRIYDGFLHLNLEEEINSTVLRIVIINFIVLAVISCFWLYGIFALIVYSVILFLFLHKYFMDLKGQYRTLLVSTSRMAEGDLDTPLDEDYGVFQPVGEELDRIRNGFRLAVEKEVKSERMKTELVTNVSHDLKTPLTAIITYVDLLKQEQDETKRKEYIEILERKSQRLKVLIEDLFEISKAASRNVTLNFMKVDIAGLLKQVELEYDRQIADADLEIRWKLPEEKLILWLDSQKTYRIFENLIVNIIKYAMPHTRVYVEMQKQAGKVSVLMKNISSSELNFDVEEITDRFVRGDVSRNTEGSGLGLAIAKNFTELQHGELKVSTDADLFKVEILFPCMKETDMDSENAGQYAENQKEES